LVDPDGSGPTSPAISMRYLHGPSVDQIMAQESANGDVQWMLTDHLGTVRDLVNNNGEVVNHLKYDSYGNVIAESDPAVGTRYKYTGREFDSETEMQYNRARYYDAAIGRFISEDPIGFAGGDANLYRYVANAPIDSNDPTGNVRQRTGEEKRAGGIKVNGINVSKIADSAHDRIKEASTMSNSGDQALEKAQERIERENSESNTGTSSCPVQKKKRIRRESKPTPFPKLTWYERLQLNKSEWETYKNDMVRNRVAVATGNAKAIPNWHYE
jgi:RHS repeat-associated protein